MLVDSHCHLDFAEFDRDRDEVVQRARDAGVTFIINPGYDLPSSRRAIGLAERYPEVYAAVGVHPHEAKTVTGDVIAALRDLAAHPKAVAIGEVGLDFYRDLSPRDVQRRACEMQLALAAELELPVIIHSRDAHDEVMSMLGRFASPAGHLAERGPGRWCVLHAFSAGDEVAQTALDMGICLGIAGPVTFAKARGLQAVARALPPERLLTETDSPYLTPHPYRGKRNEPARVRLVAEALAAIRGVSITQVGRWSLENARRLFGL